MYNMGFFSTILEKLGLKKDDDKPASAGAGAAGASKPQASVGAAAGGKQTIDKGDKDDAISKLGANKAISEVDVVKQLEQKAAGSGLNWKTSIVDLLKILDIDSSKDARIELAKELGCPPDLIGGDYSKMNEWLHKTVLKKIAENGGNIPANLLD
jgi:hypothetical protein